MLAAYASDAAVFQVVQTFRYSALAALTILFYDYCLTFHLELEQFWKRFTFSWASALFVANRYLPLLSLVPALIDYFWDLSESTCQRLLLVHGIFAMICQIIVGALLTIRTYALYNRSKRVLSLLLVTGLVMVFVAIPALFSSKGLDSNIPPFGPRWPACDLSLSDQQDSYNAGAWGCMVGFDTLIFILTVIRAVRSESLWTGSLLRRMLRDGTIYYGLMTMANIVNIVTLLAVAPGNRGLFIPMTNVISSALVTRLMLNLRSGDRQMSLSEIELTLLGVDL